MNGLAERKRSLAFQARVLQSTGAALVTSSDWQSPSYEHAVWSMAGRYTGRITEHADDYKRDRHQDAAAYERAYLREYIDGWERLNLGAVMTASGMAAFTTILGYLTMERLSPGAILVGRSTYHECRDLLRAGPLGSRTREVPEPDTDRLLTTIDATDAGTLFMDTLCNARGIPVPDVARIIQHVGRRGRPFTLVLDNTGRSCSFQPFSLLPCNPSQLRLIVFESLTKYPQFGLDRATGGMIVASPGDARGLDRYREHLGTNVTDSTVWTIPEPNRAILLRRLGRLGRNAALLARRLSEVAEDHPGALEGIGHPSLARHPSHHLLDGSAFPGGFLSLDLRPHLQRTDVYRAMVRSMLEEARRRRVPLAAGASFGFDTTRIYLTAATAACARPYLRVSSGTEHLAAATAVADVLCAAVTGLGGLVSASDESPGRIGLRGGLE
jgi:cystathionine beta-lyase/cystathionine gamma-synthase